MAFKCSNSPVQPQTETLWLSADPSCQWKQLKASKTQRAPRSWAICTCAFIKATIENENLPCAGASCLRSEMPPPGCHCRSSRPSWAGRRLCLSRRGRWRWRRICHGTAGDWTWCRPSSSSGAPRWAPPPGKRARKVSNRGYIVPCYCTSLCRLICVHPQSDILPPLVAVCARLVIVTVHTSPLFVLNPPFPAIMSTIFSPVLLHESHLITLPLWCRFCSLHVSTSWVLFVSALFPDFSAFPEHLSAVWPRLTVAVIVD